MEDGTGDPPGRKQGLPVKSEKHLARVREIPCLICEKLGLGQTPAAAHHLFRPEDRCDYLTAPLCHAHHQGPAGFHGLGGERGFERIYRINEAGLLALTIQKLMK